MSDLTCSICLNDDPVLPISLSCKHIFCYLCIKGFKLSQYNANCPLCREPISDEILTKLSLDDCVSKIDQKVDYQWLYKGNNNGWWKYDVEHNEELENMYQDYMLEITNKRPKIHLIYSQIMTSAASNSNNLSNSSDDSDSDDQESDADSDTIEPEYVLRIGIMKFRINFDNMSQTNQQGHMRKIARLKAEELDEYKDIIKGIAGLSIKKN